MPRRPAVIYCSLITNNFTNMFQLLISKAGAKMNMTQVPIQVEPFGHSRYLLNAPGYHKPHYFGTKKNSTITKTWGHIINKRKCIFLIIVELWVCYDNFRFFSNKSMKLSRIKFVIWVRSHHLPYKIMHSLCSLLLSALFALKVKHHSCATLHSDHSWNWGFT